MSDSQFRIGTLAGAFVLVVLITYLRFCGSVSLPSKPPPPSGPSGTQRELLKQSTGSKSVYKTFLDSDAQNAGVSAPSISDMQRKLAYRVDEARHALEPGKPPIDLAGLRLHVERSGDQVLLVIENKLDTDVAYNVVTLVSGSSQCTKASPLPFNAMVISKGSTERRTECLWRDGMSIAVTKVETLEVLPLSAWYLSQVPPSQVGVEDRIARGHRGVQTSEVCSPVMPAVVRTALDRGDLGWRDLVDFYARHRCQTYQFPTSYRAIKSDGERSIPAVDG
ncbi:MAG TPA: hypothetical protein VL856_02840 [Acidimicrobiia bacterium]|nr:hypothetical protein [Acidimicrobiia bacterium]